MWSLKIHQTHQNRKGEGEKMKQIKLFFGGGSNAPLEPRVNEFCKTVNVVDIKLAEGEEGITTIMVIYEESSKLMICLDAEVRTTGMRVSIIEILSKHKGSNPVYVLEKETGEVKAFPSMYNVCITEKLVNELKVLVGEDNIALDCV